MRDIYLDNAGTTMPADEVLTAMIPYMQDMYGNPGSLHDIGSGAKRAVDDSREAVARFMGCDPDHVIFTSGGSEANSIIVSGFKGDGTKAYTEVEHPSIIKSMEYLYGKSKSKPLAVRSDGTVRATVLEDAIRRGDVDLVAAMWVNNELGSVNDIPYLADICRMRNVWFHTDCVQAAGGIELRAEEIGVDSMSISSHKIHGPKGVGALYIRDLDKINPLIFGGQERGLRGGTENVPGIVGFAKACELVMRNFDETVAKIRSRKLRMINVLTFLAKKNSIEDLLHFNNSYGEDCKILNLRFDGIDGQTLLMMMNARGVYASAGSACTSREMHPSHVLKAIGLSDEQAYNSIRLSFSRYTTAEDVDDAAGIIIDSVLSLIDMKEGE